MRVFKAFINAFFVSNPWRPHILDSRRKVLPLHNLSQYWLRGTKAGGLSSTALSRIRRHLIDAGWTRGLGPPVFVSLLIAGFFFGFSAWLIWYPGRGMPGVLPLLLALSGLLQVLIAATRRFRVPKADAQIVARAFLREGLCPACGFPLPDSPAIGDVVICSECGAHWESLRSV